jgi:hypothetical protein
MVAGIKAMEILQKERRSKNQNKKEVYPSTQSLPRVRMYWAGNDFWYPSMRRLPNASSPCEQKRA